MSTLRLWILLLGVAGVCAPRPLASQLFADLSPQVREFVSVEATHVVIHGVRLIDGTGAPAREDMSIVIRDGRITRVEPTATIGDVAGAEPIDGTGHTLIPGLVMLHEHMFYPSGLRG